MANVLIEESTMSAIGNAIREKTGKTGLILPKDMPTEIESIEEDNLCAYFEGTLEVIDLDIKSPRQYALAYSTADVVNLPNVTTLNDYTFYRSSVVEVNLPNVTGLGGDAFYGCSNLTRLNAPKLKTVSSRVFQNCKALTEVNLPLLEVLNPDTFNGCTSLVTVNLPKVKNMSASFSGCAALKNVYIPLAKSIPIECFKNCSSIEVIDFPRLTSIKSDAFYGCTNLTTLILRNTETVCSVHNRSFVSAGIKSAGYIYVPSALIEQYKVAENWTTYAERFRSLEDYTVDGTVTGELDETKISA